MRDTSYEEALSLKRLDFAKQISQYLQTENSIAQQTVELYDEILEEFIGGIVAEVHREIKTGSVDTQVAVLVQALRSSLDAELKEYRTPVARLHKRGPDVFGNSDAAGLSAEVHCSNCGRKIAASRFAPHLEKCMGKGRNASRNVLRS